jgi:hypothetical protein
LLKRKVTQTCTSSPLSARNPKKGFSSLLTSEIDSSNVACLNERTDGKRENAGQETRGEKTNFNGELINRQHFPPPLPNPSRPLGRFLFHSRLPHVDNSITPSPHKSAMHHFQNYCLSQSRKANFHPKHRKTVACQTTDLSNTN